MSFIVICNYLYISIHFMFKHTATDRQPSLLVYSPKWPLAKRLRRQGSSLPDGLLMEALSEEMSVSVTLRETSLLLPTES